MQLVMLETNGNQAYVFSSPRLREVIGASSQLVLLPSWTDEALEEHLNVPKPANPARSPSDFGECWVSRASGKVIFTVAASDDARKVIGTVTRRALAEAPGVDVSGVFVDMGSKRCVDENLLRAVHTEASKYAIRRPPAQSRFSQMPFLARAKDSALPASPPLGVRDEAKMDIEQPLSLPSRVKRHQAYRARLSLTATACERDSDLNDLNREDLLAQHLLELETKMRQAFNPTASPAPGPEDQKDQDPNMVFDRLEAMLQDGESQTISKVGVVHIDGNGIGAIMRNLERAKDLVPESVLKEMTGSSNDGDALRRFVLAVSLHLNDAITKAFAEAWLDTAKWAKAQASADDIHFAAVPVVPVLLGGDDVTAIVSGTYALPFASAFLRHFEQATAGDQLLCHLHNVSESAPGGTGPAASTGPMTAAAGVAVVRRNFPFHIAYDIAEHLVKRAKAVGKKATPPCSTLDYHVLFDTTVLAPKEILDGYSKFTSRPYRFVKDVNASGPETGTDESVSPQPVYPTWAQMCERAANFKGLGTSHERFPRTRATRIRKLLSDSKPDEADKPDSKPDEADKHWSDARQEVGWDIEEELGGSKNLFDLLELSDLLPDSYLMAKTGRGEQSGQPEEATTDNPEGAA